MPERRPAPGDLSPASGSTDALRTACLTGAPGAAEELFRAYAPTVQDTLVRFLARRCRGRTDLAEDLTHEVFVAVLRDGARKLATFQGRDGCSLASWLRVVAVRLAIDALRRDRRLRWLDDGTPGMDAVQRSLVSATDGPEASVDAAETATRLERAIAGLGTRDRLLVELHLRRGAPLEQVASTLGVTMNAAYVRKSRVLDRLRRAIRDETIP